MTIKMCSVIDLIDKQKCYIKSKQKTIQSLYEFLDSIDKPFDKKIESNVDKKQVFLDSRVYFLI